jgi:alkaline phosphatase D
MSLLLNRRRLMQGAGASLGAVALRGFVVADDGVAHFTHGVASGDPLADRVILWTRVVPGANQNQPLHVGWQVAKDREFKQVVAQGTTQSIAERDHTVKVDATGLQSDSRYFYRFTVDGRHSATGRTRTLPVGAVDSFRLGVASCSNYPQGYFNAYRHMAQSDIDLVLHLGDYIYEYPEGGYANQIALEELGRHVEPLGEILSLEDYRMRYGLYRTDADLQLLHQQHPFVCVWDDHELTNNTWHSGAQNHNDGEGDFFQRMQAARRAYDEWMPIRTHASGDQGPIYRAFEIGDLADLIMLDTRLHGRDKGLEYASDVPLQSQAFEALKNGEGRAISDDEAQRLPAKSVRRVNVPFDFSSGTAEAVLDFATIKDLDESSLPANWRYLPDLQGFKTEILNAPQRNLLGDDQEQWLTETLRRAQSRGSTWQVLGQQVLMGRLFLPQLNDEEMRLDTLPEGRANRLRSMQAMAGQGLPFNLDAWDGYPACRSRVQGELKRFAANPVVLAGDTHNAWAFNLRDEHQNPVGVEIGTPGITSPGMESFLPVKPNVLAEALRQSSPELAALDTQHRGWAEVELTPKAMRAQWHFVSTILDHEFTTTRSEPQICPVGARQFA